MKQTHTETDQSVLERIIKADNIKQEDIIAECCVCNRYRDGNIWYDPTDKERYRTVRVKFIPHTYCEDCYKKEMFKKVLEDE